MADNRTPGAARRLNAPPPSIAELPPPRATGVQLSAAARIAQLEQLARCASVVSGDGADGVAGLGSTVRVADEAGETMEFVLVGRRAADSTRHEVSLASPVGKALVGVRPGDVARVALPSGRARLLRVLDVTNGLLAAKNVRPDGAVEAA